MTRNQTGCTPYLSESYSSELARRLHRAEKVSALDLMRPLSDETYGALRIARDFGHDQLARELSLLQDRILQSWRHLLDKDLQEKTSEG